jgi:hypothetical protein
MGNQIDINSLKIRAAAVRDETLSAANTALRVGQLLIDMVVTFSPESMSEFFVRKDEDAFFSANVGSDLFQSGFDGAGWMINPSGDAWLGSISVRGESTFAGNAKSSSFKEAPDGEGWMITSAGKAWLEEIRVRNGIGSETFVSGFPGGQGWDLHAYKQLNAAGVEEEKWRLETDDIVVRGQLKVFEMIISQLRGENDNVIFAGMMKVDHYDPATGRIYLQTEGILYNTFRNGDILCVQRYGGLPSAENNYNVIKQYELQVDEAAIGDMSAGEKRLDHITFVRFVGDLNDVAQGDVLTRLDSVSDLTRKGIVKVTTIDEAGAPYVEVKYAMKTDPAHSTKARLGNLSGIRTASGQDLDGVWGLYAEGAVLENSQIFLNNGMTVEQNFTVMNGSLSSEIAALKESVADESGNILRNSIFSDSLWYWDTENEVSVLSAGGLLWMNTAYYARKNRFAQIHKDEGRSVLRLKDTTITQSPDYFRFDFGQEQPAAQRGFYLNYTADGQPSIRLMEAGGVSPLRFAVKGDDWETYSFSFFYRALSEGILRVGIAGTELYAEVPLSPADGYTKFTKVGKWDKSGGAFVFAASGEVLIHSAVLRNDALSNAYVKLETAITQNANQIALRATKTYVDGQDGAIQQFMETQLSLTAEEIALRATKVYVDESLTVLETAITQNANQIALRATKTYVDSQDSSAKTALESKITIEAGKISALSTKVDGIKNTISSAGWVTSSDGNTLWAAKSMEDGSTIVSKINQTAASVKIQAGKINLSGAVTTSMLATDVTSLIASKANTSALANYVPQGAVAAAMASEGLIAGGYIKASLIDVDSIFSNAVYARNSIYIKNSSGAVDAGLSSAGNVANSVRIFAGGTSIDTAKFKVLSNGRITGTDMILTTTYSGHTYTGIYDGSGFTLQQAGTSDVNSGGMSCSNGSAGMYINKGGTLSEEGFISCATGESNIPLFSVTGRKFSGEWMHRTLIRCAWLPTQDLLKSYFGTSVVGSEGVNTVKHDIKTGCLFI